MEKFTCSGEDINKNALWVKNQIKQEQIDKYLIDGKDFIDEKAIWSSIESNKNPEASRIRAIIKKSFKMDLLDRDDIAALVNVNDPILRKEIFAAAKEIKRKVYDNRVVVFAPLYMGSKCVNRCTYCGFRADNKDVERKVLTMEEVEQETDVLANVIGHKRLIIVFGEHPETDANYIVDCMKHIYKVKGKGEIRRVNINAAPMSIEDMGKIKDAGIGTFQVFQETYDHNIYSQVHPKGTLKGDYRWRLYALHRAMDAGIDDVATGVLLGLNDWKFEIVAMMEHARDLERYCGIGPHTVSVPRLEPASGSDFSWVKHWVSDEDFLHLVAVLRLAIPYTGLIVTNREKPEILRKLSDIITQRDADSRIGIGAYKEAFDRGEIGHESQAKDKQQFILGDARSLSDIIKELAEDGHIVSFCTAGYRCGRTGDKIMCLLKSGTEGHFCKLNAILTYREWLDDFGSEETKKMGYKLIEKELKEVKDRVPYIYKSKQYLEFLDAYTKSCNGKRDIYF